MSGKDLYILADDDEDDRLLFSDAFKEIAPEYELMVLNDGQFLMEYLLEKPNLLPKVIFVDLNMPRKDGFQCISEIKSNPAWKEMQVVVFSTSAQEQSIQRARLLGADNYMQKPSTYQELKNLVYQVINRPINGSEYVIKPVYL